jgi:hypothetical protein
MLGKPIRVAIGGRAVIRSNAKVAACGATLDIPLGRKDDPWPFDHFGTITATMSDAPCADEIAIVLAMSDGGRLNSRRGQTPH